MSSHIIAAAAALALAGCASAQAQTAAPAPPPCTTAEFHQMDFWLGDWDGRWDASPSMPAGQGRNIITREYGGCVIQEAFTGDASTGDLIGHSVSTYDAPSQRWRQTWVDNQGGYYALIGGPEGDDFILHLHRPRDNVLVQRMVFEDITPQAFTWRWQRTPDAGATWADQWVIQYTRRAPG
ncbi:hypothetical protein U91I_02214 [alpha proteobacterium U9-1i]|nr:hypothetical protein U91I_02214 [alpha proteobacterium U9-1i]